MHHRSTLLRATLTALLVLVALGAAFADPLEGAPPVPFPPTGARPGASGLPGGVTTVPKNIPGAPPATEKAERSDREGLPLTH